MQSMMRSPTPFIQTGEGYNQRSPPRAPSGHSTAGQWAVYVSGCEWVYVCVHTHKLVCKCVECRGQPQRLLLRSCPCCFLRESCTSLKLTSEFRLAGQQAWETCSSLCLQRGDYKLTPPHRGLFFTWILEIQTQALMMKASTLPTEQSPKPRTADL